MYMAILSPRASP